MERNLIYNIQDGFSYQLTSGKENILRNNILVSEEGRLLNLAFFYDKEEHLAITIENNIIFGKWFKPFSGKKIGARADFRKNLYWDPTKTPVDVTEKAFAARQKDGQDIDAIVAKPDFEEPDKSNFSLKTEAASKKNGFKPFNWKQAGVYGAADWVKKAKEIQYAPYKRRQAPPLTFFDDFENTPVGIVPERAVVSIEKKGDSILVSDEAAASGKNSLKISKVPGLRYVFNPHFYYNPRQSQGIAKLSFDIKVEESTQMICEWRQYPGKPYYTGPQIAVKNCLLSTLGKSMLPVPCGKWFRVEMSSGQGDQADGTWNLKVTIPDGQPQYFKNLKLGNPDTKLTNWIGFVSGQSDSSVYYIDNINMSNSEVH
jgi:hypothetical protein